MGVNKYIFVTGGVLSGVGKGITAASIGAVLQAKGLTVSIQKCDPYLNVDAGLLNPIEHGECFVTKDGAETDLDLGHYERFLDIELTRKNTTLSGRLLIDIINKERVGGFDGKTVQLVPHLTDAIQEKIVEAGEDSDVHIVEIGGTVGDYESLSFIEAIREFAWKKGRENCAFIHVVYVPFIETSKEFKTKPAQNALNDLRSFGIVPDAVIVRSEKPAPQSVAQKIALFGGIPNGQVQLMPNVDTVFRIPEILASNGILKLLENFTGNHQKPDLSKWRKVIGAQSVKSAKNVRIGLVADHLDNEDIHISTTEALKSAGWDQDVNIDIKWLKPRELTPETIDSIDGILMPDGSESDNFEARVNIAKLALEYKKPYLGLSLGMQIACVAAARKSGILDAGSAEFTPENKSNVIKPVDGNIVVGDFESILNIDSKVAKIYDATSVIERRRNRYELDPRYIEQLAAGGLVVSGTSPDKSSVEFVESKNHPFFIATQSHPEFKSRPFRAHPLFREFIRASLDAG